MRDLRISVACLLIAIWLAPLLIGMVDLSSWFLGLAWRIAPWDEDRVGVSVIWLFLGGFTLLPLALSIEE